MILIPNLDGEYQILNGNLKITLDPTLKLDRLVGHPKGIKSLLLDQRAVCSGIGNWIADEVCYQTKIHPDQNFLTVKEVESIRLSIRKILNRAHVRL